MMEDSPAADKRASKRAARKGFGTGTGHPGDTSGSLPRARNRKLLSNLPQASERMVDDKVQGDSRHPAASAASGTMVHAVVVNFR
jgi:hypothetical protein